MKIEVGKTYLDTSGIMIEILTSRGWHGDTVFLGLDEWNNTEWYGLDGTNEGDGFDLASEHRELIDIYICRNYLANVWDTHATGCNCHSTLEDAQERVRRLGAGWTVARFSEQEKDR